MPKDHALQVLLYLRLHSAPYLEMEKPALLKEQWPPIKLFKLKKLFEANSTATEGSREKTLTYEAFISLLPELAEDRYSAYTEVQSL